MSREQRRALVERSHRRLSVVRQCRLVGISRSSFYYQRKPTSPGDLELMAAMDRQYLETLYFGSRRMLAWFQARGHCIGRKRIRRLMRVMRLKAIYQRPRTSPGSPAAQRHPYLLRGLAITRPDQVWAADITYIPMAKGFLYLVVVMDWHSRCVLAWRLSNTLDSPDRSGWTRWRKS
ncbi:MAG: IS3 family transposase [Dehalococcoidia bacterium]|nr:IS3 family transposase [Dehalococcoidia bacterium]